MRTVNLQLEEGELARPVKDFEYLITSFGRIFSMKRGKWMKPCENKSVGYLQVNLYKEGQVKRTSVHRLVAQAFLPNYTEDLQVNHLDEDKKNNCVENLAMCTAKENNNYGTRNQRAAEKLRNDPKRSKRVLCLTNGVIFPSISEASRQLNLNSGNITACCNGKQKQTGGFSFQYL